MSKDIVLSIKDGAIDWIGATEDIHVTILDHDLDEVRERTFEPHDIGPYETLIEIGKE